MADEIICKGCGTKNKPGAIMCENCGDPLEVAVGTAPPRVVASSPVVAVVGVTGRACAFIEAGKITDKEFELPSDDFSFAIGRTELSEGIIPDIDLIKYVDKVKTEDGKIGYKVSRKQATISRRMGKLYLKALGGARTMVRLPGEDWKELKKDEEVELHVGGRFRFGGSEGYAIFEVV